MANTNSLFQTFNGKLMITETKKSSLMTSRDNLREKIRSHFEENHSSYKPTFYIQGSYKMKTTIRTKDDTCDLDDGVYFKNNKDNVTGTTLQRWVKEAVEDVTDTIPSHQKKCVTVDYKAGYNIDFPVFLFNEDEDAHPKLAVKDGEWKEDDPKEFVNYFNRQKDSKGQLLRIVRYLKAWCDFKREKMPSGLAMTILAMNNYYPNERDDVALKFTLIEIENALTDKFECIMQTTPYDNIFEEYSESRKQNFMDNLAAFVKDAKKAVDEEVNRYKASKLWQKHLGDRFPEGEDKDEKQINTSKLNGTIGAARPYCFN